LFSPSKQFHRGIPNNPTYKKLKSKYKKMYGDTAAEQYRLDFYKEKFKEVYSANKLPYG